MGLSGGVDSAVAASLLKKEYEVIGVTLQMQGDCFDSEDARSVARRLEIEHHVIDCRTEFQAIKDYVTGEYLNGRTPNPCVRCNPTIKFAKMLAFANEAGADFIATGHYSEVVKSGERYTLKKSDYKDQTYVLYGLTQEQLSRTLMPLANRNKDDVRALAAGLGLSVAEKPDSQDMCFEPQFPEVPEGNFVDAEGNVLGRHKGIIHYTVGQRKGLGIALGQPVYVKEIRPDANEVVLNYSDVYCDRIRINQINCVGIPEIEEGKYIAKIRYSHKGQMCSIIRLGADEAEIVFDEPARAATPGQSAVLYDEAGRVMLGGVIE